MARDNGEAGAGGQRPRRAFPSLLSRFLQGLRGRMNPVRESGFQQGFDTFFERLERDWVRSEQLAIPQWSGAHDHLSIFRRGLAL